MATKQEYLESVLRDQELANDSAEMSALRQHRADVERLLRRKFGNSVSIRYGGSKAKGTMNRESYDLDLTCYFAAGDESAGSSLTTIFEAVEKALQEEYWTERKGSAIRLYSRDDVRVDFHIDVVPGRFVEDNEGDVHLYRTSGEKAYLKTNLDTHIAHVRGGGVVAAIRLLKLWARRKHVGIKTFALELLAIDLLRGRKTRELADQLEHVMTEFRDRVQELTIEDPANPYGNDLSELLNDAVRFNLETTARATLEQVERDGWEGVFGPVEGQDRAARAAAIQRLAAAASVRSQPWAKG
ncbi:MAG: hypothetical protein GEU90_21465 [Gemmatimonas sp.]|nr:hypothetical protein [Gemmatimonas sp.]